MSKELNNKQLEIMYAAEELIANNGFVGTSVRDIAKKAKVNVAMISYYFGSKEKLLQQLLLYRTENSRVLLDHLKHDDHLSPWEKIDSIIDFYVDNILDHRKFHIIMSRQLSLIQDKKSIKILVEIKSKNRESIHEILEEGVTKGVFREVDIPLTISTVIGTISQVCMSTPFYKKVFNVKANKEDKYFQLIRPRLKQHLKSMVRSHLAKNGN